MYCRSKKDIVFFLFPSVLLVAVFVYFAIGMNGYYSLFSWNAFSADMDWVGLQNFTRLFQDETFAIAMRNTILVVIFSVIFQVGLSMVLAAILEQKWLRKFGAFCRTVFFIPSVLSMTIVALLWQLALNSSMGFVNELLRNIGLDSWAMDWLGNSHTAIYCVIFTMQWQFIGYTMMLFIVAMQNVPPDYYEVASLDGASPMQQFIYITIPNIKETILLNCVTTVVGSFKTFEQVYALTASGPGRASEVLGTMLYREAFRDDRMGYASAIGVVIFVITMICSYFQIRMFNVNSIERGGENA